jgi:hypothetical protein
VVGYDWIEGRAQELGFSIAELSRKVMIDAKCRKDLLRRCFNGDSKLQLSEAFALAEELRASASLLLSKLGHEVPTAAEILWGDDYDYDEDDEPASSVSPGGRGTD